MGPGRAGNQVGDAVAAVDLVSDERHARLSVPSGMDEQQLQRLRDKTPSLDPPDRGSPEYQQARLAYAASLLSLYGDQQLVDRLLHGRPARARRWAWRRG